MRNKVLKTYRIWYSEGEELFGSAAESLSTILEIPGQKDSQLEIVLINLLIRQDPMAVILDNSLNSGLNNG